MRAAVGPASSPAIEKSGAGTRDHPVLLLQHLARYRLSGTGQARFFAGEDARAVPEQQLARQGALGDAQMSRRQQEIQLPLLHQSHLYRCRPGAQMKDITSLPQQAFGQALKGRELPERIDADRELALIATVPLADDLLAML
ncbi:hypothetical protein [Marinobacterium aestuariivivens]|uniref:Uncharacterized protein n=1 Tax=Marinobacterium aestuariivivens TaxID=1698799 RepID=A0ABW2A6Z6_9GAMM